MASVVVDLRSRKVPNVITFGIALVGMAFAAGHVSDMSPAPRSAAGDGWR